MPDFATTDAAHAALKDALTDVLRENRDWLRDLVQEALIEVAVAEARREADVRAFEAEREGIFPVPPGQA